MNRFSERASLHQYRTTMNSGWPEGENKRAAMSAARAALKRELAFDITSRVTNRV
jgi:hypothetical protein